MSYDLMVFEPEAAPREHERFLEWYSEQTKWNEGHSYGDPAITSVRLRGWVEEIAKSFPPMNGVMASSELPKDEASATDYSIGKQIVYGCFAWSKAVEAYEAVFRLAARHAVGFFNVSSPLQEVWLPRGGELVFAHHKSAGFMDKIRKLFVP